LSDEQMTAWVSPLAVNAAAAATASSSASLPGAAMPPISKNVRAKAVRAACDAIGPMLARKIAGRLPVAVAAASLRSRSASNGAA
jgi:hypothetical protein